MPIHEADCGRWDAVPIQQLTNHCFEFHGPSFHYQTINAPSEESRALSPERTVKSAGGSLLALIDEPELRLTCASASRTVRP